MHSRVAEVLELAVCYVLSRDSVPTGFRKLKAFSSSSRGLQHVLKRNVWDASFGTYWFPLSLFSFRDRVLLSRNTFARPFRSVLLSAGSSTRVGRTESRARGTTGSPNSNSFCCEVRVRVGNGVDSAFVYLRARYQLGERGSKVLFELD